MAIEVIRDLNDPRTAMFTGKLPDDLFIAESPSVIEKALNAGIVPRAMLAERAQAERFKQASCPVYTAEREALAALTGYHLTRGVLCAMERPAMRDADEICAQGRRIGVLEHIADPANVGAIFRCAAALGMDGILLTGNCADPLYRKATRAAMGTTFILPWAICDDPIPVLHRHGYFAIAMALRSDAMDIGDPSLYAHDRIAIALGNEGFGLSAAIIDPCDATAIIPMHNGVDSLNVATAASIIFYRLSLFAATTVLPTVSAASCCRAINDESAPP